MDFTREPIIETVITPKEGYKLVVRSSKASGQEEFFVDAVEVVSFGKSMFFRSQEKPKSFLVPTSDYEVLEVREARMVLKHVGVDRSIKIGGGKDTQRPTRESAMEKEQQPVPIPVTPTVSETPLATPADAPIPDESKTDGSRFDRKRDRRRHYRRRRGREEGKEGWTEGAEGEESGEESERTERVSLAPPREADVEGVPANPATMSTSLLSSLLPPPPNLISETIAKYRENDKFKDVFFPKEGQDEPSPLELEPFDGDSEEKSGEEDREEGVIESIREEISEDVEISHHSITEDADTAPLNEEPQQEESVQDHESSNSH